MDGGGGEQQTLLLLKNIDRSRFEPRLWLARRDGVLLPSVPNDVAIDEFSAPPPRLYWPGRAHARTVAAMTRLAKRQTVDVVYDQTFAMTLLAAAAVDRLAIPRVSTIMSPPEHAVPLLERRFIEIKRRRLAAAYRRSAAIISVSRNAAESAERFYQLPAGRIETILSAVDVDRLRSMPRPQHRRGIVVVGRMTVEKGHADLLAALRLVDPETRKRCPVRLVGDGPLRSDLETMSRESGLADTVTFVGHVPDAAPEIAAADLLVLPSRFEGFPNVVLEAMTLGTPVLATDVGGTAEVSTDPDRPAIALVPANDAATLASEIERLIVDDQRRTRLSQRATEVIDQNHHVRPVTSRIENVIAAAVNQNARQQ